MESMKVMLSVVDVMASRENERRADEEGKARATKKLLPRRIDAPVHNSETQRPPLPEGGISTLQCVVRRHGEVLS